MLWHLKSCDISDSNIHVHADGLFIVRNAVHYQSWSCTTTLSSIDMTCNIMWSLKQSNRNITTEVRSYLYRRAGSPTEFAALIDFCDWTVCLIYWYITLELVTMHFGKRIRHSVIERWKCYLYLFRCPVAVMPRWCCKFYSIQLSFGMTFLLPLIQCRCLWWCLVVQGSFQGLYNVRPYNTTNAWWHLLLVRLIILHQFKSQTQAHNTNICGTLSFSFCEQDAWEHPWHLPMLLTGNIK